MNKECWLIGFSQWKTMTKEQKESYCLYCSNEKCDKRVVAQETKNKN